MERCEIPWATKDAVRSRKGGDTAIRAMSSQGARARAWVPKTSMGRTRLRLIRRPPM